MELFSMEKFSLGTQVFASTLALFLLSGGVNSQQRCSTSTSCANPSLCCSQYDYCDFTPEHCGVGCKHGPCLYGPAPGVAAVGRCLSDNTCPNNLCCSKDSYCGTSADYCGAGCLGGPCTATPGSTNGSVSGTQASTSSSNTGVIVGVVVGIAAAIGLIAALLYFFYFRKRSPLKPWEKELERFIFRKYSLGEIRALTDNFSEERVLGRGGFAVVYRGLSSSGQVCAVKKHTTVFGNSFEQEVRQVSGLRHKNLIILLGYCIDGGEHILVYELAPNGSLEDQLRPQMGDNSVPLTVQQRLKIVKGAAEGLLHLHNHNIIHRDVKPGNILIDKDFEPRVADFGIAKEVQAADVESIYTSHVAGSRGYIDPDYFMNRRLTYKADVYSLGVVMLEAITGRGPAVSLEDRRAVQNSDKDGNTSEQLPLVGDSSVRQAGNGLSFSTAGSSAALSSWESFMSMLVGNSEVQAEANAAPPSTPASMHLLEWARRARDTYGVPGYLSVVLEPELLVSLGTVDESSSEFAALNSYFELALACGSPYDSRPAMSDVIPQLTSILQIWKNAVTRGGEEQEHGEPQTAVLKSTGQ